MAFSPGSDFVAPSTVSGMGAAPAGLQYLPSGTVLSAALIAATQAAGFTGWWLDARGIYPVASGGLIIQGVQNFTIASEMRGGIGYNGVAIPPIGYINTGSAATDGVAISSTGTGAAQTAGIMFSGVAFIGSNSNAVVHMGGGQRDVRFENCYIQNTGTTAGQYGLITDTAIENRNSENCSYFQCDIVGGYAAVGIGIADQTQHSNDTLWDNLRTSGGTYSIVAAAGGSQHFLDYYDRSNASTATVLNSGCSLMIFDGGEDQNTTGLDYSITGSAARVVLIDRNITQSGAATTTVSLTNGFFFCIGVGTVNNAQTWTMATGSPTIFIDNSYNAANATISGSVGTLVFYPAAVYSAPTATSATFTGLTTFAGGYPVQVAQANAKGATTTQSLTYTPPAVAAAYRAVFICKITAHVTSTTPALSYTDEGGVAENAAPIVWKMGTVAGVASMVASGYYFGQVEFATDNSQGTITMTLTPTGDTFNYSFILERIR